MVIVIFVVYWLHNLVGQDCFPSLAGFTVSLDITELAFRQKDSGSLRTGSLLFIWKTFLINASGYLS